jgi:phosphonoacetaldehyde hydrolase
LSAAEWNALSDPSEKQRILGRAAERLKHAGAHYLAESVADCLGLIEEIDARLGAGEKP